MVACKLPHGFRISLGDEHIHLKGPKRYGNTHDIMPGAIGITQVERSFWEKWSTLNLTLDPVRRGFIFAQNNKSDLKAESKEKETLKTGLERLDPDAVKEELEHNPQQAKMV